MTIDPRSMEVCLSACPRLSVYSSVCLFVPTTILSFSGKLIARNSSFCFLSLSLSLSLFLSINGGEVSVLPALLSVGRSVRSTQHKGESYYCGEKLLRSKNSRKTDGLRLCSLLSPVILHCSTIDPPWVGHPSRLIDWDQVKRADRG